MNRAKLIEYYLDKLSKPGFEFHQVRQELEANHIDEDDVRIIVKLIDKELQNRAVTKSSNKYSNNIILFGAFLTVLGAFLTIATYLNAIGTGNSFIIAYGPFLAGISILIAGLVKKRKG
ncbi:MAG TPA: hypothetical protein PLJ60_05700 [Chryseolinea sp.]|nr:hypothetical protein [Chryseolinea sp.]HPH45975.1 hypothetical protein [Chryseolinea sp.]HPM29812.1 hypothetical protein [Chryseolinea sp.]